MANETIQGLKRISWLPDRDATENGTLIAGQEYDDVEFIGGEISNADLINCTIDGSPFYNTPSIEVDTTILVPTDYSTPLAAMQYLMGFLIMPGVTVTISVSAGTYTHTLPLPAHPQSNQITITGPSVTFPTGSDFVITGNSAPARATDNANHLIMLKAKYGAEIYCSNTQAIDSRHGMGVPTLNNLLFWTDNTTGVAAYIYDCLCYMNKVSFHGWNDLGLALTNNGHIRTGNLTLSGMNGVGIQYSDGGELKSIDTFISASNANAGVFGKRGGIAEISGAIVKGNSAEGILVQDDAICEASNSAAATQNGGSGFMVQLGGVLNAVGSTSSNNTQYGYLVDVGGVMYASTSEASDNGSGGYAVTGVGMMYAGSSVSDSNTGSGYFADELGQIFCEFAEATDNTNINYFARNGGRISAYTSTSDGAGVDGYRADSNGSFIDCRDSICTNSVVNGFYAYLGGHVYASGATSGTLGNGNGLTGFLAEDGGYMIARNAICQYNAGRGLYAVTGGIIDGENATVNNNTGVEIRVSVYGMVYVAGITGLTTGEVDGDWNQQSNIVTALPVGYEKFPAPSTLTIATGVVTATSSYHSIDTEGAAATDDLDTISGTVANSQLLLKSVSNARVPTLKDGTGNLKLTADFTFNTTEDRILLQSDGTNLFEISRNSGIASKITVANEASDTTCFPLFGTAATGDLLVKSNTGLTYNSSTNAFGATSFVGALTGNASTATALQNARTIGGVSFDGTGNITVASATGGFAVSGGDLAVGANNITCTGSIGSTGSRLTKGWFTDLQVTNAISGSVTGNAATVTTNANLTGPVTSSGNATTTIIYETVALSDEVTALTTGTSKMQWVAPYACTMGLPVIYVNTAPTGAALIFDINKNTVTIYSTNPQIEVSELTTATSATPGTLNGTITLAANDRLTFDIDQIGSTIAGAGAKVYLPLTRTT